MLVLVVNVGNVWMHMNKRFVRVKMRMRFARWCVRGMRMLVVLIMRMQVGVTERPMVVRMLVPFTQV